MLMKMELLNTVGGNIKPYNQYEKQYNWYSKNKKAQLPYDPAILLLGVYPKKFKARS